MPELKLGDVSPTRDFTFVEDTCRGLVALAECDVSVGKTVNIGSNFEISIADLFTLIKEIMGSEISLRTDESRMRPSKSEVYRLWCDNSLLKDLTGFEPQVKLREGLLKTIEWFSQQENSDRYRADIYNV